MPGIASCLDSTTIMYKMFRSLAQPLVIASTTLLCTDGIDLVRLMDASEEKNEIKDQFSFISSMVSSFNMFISLADFFPALINEGAWRKLTNKQRAKIAALVLVALVGFGYSLADFGVEHNTLSSGLSGAGGVLALNAATESIKFFAAKNRAALVINQEDVSENTPLNSPKV